MIAERMIIPIRPGNTYRRTTASAGSMTARTMIWAQFDAYVEREK